MTDDTHAFKNVPRKWLTDQQRARLFLERGGCCHKCSRKLGPADKWIVEHLLALQNGGTNEWENLTVTCSWCVPQKNAEDAAKAAKTRAIAVSHIVPRSERKQSRSSFRKKPPGTKFDWSSGRYVRIGVEDE